MSKKSTFMAFLMGGLIGSTVALLYAPQSGEETRQKLYDEGAELRDNAMESIREVRDTSLSAIKDAQTRMELLAKETRDALEEIRGIDQTVIVEEKKKQKQAES
ncbi:MAG: YtxH domain-containing protein [Anaerolineales bacterium]